MPRKQEFRKGTASYRLAKAQGRLPAKKGKPIKKVISDIGKALGSLTGRKDLSATRTNISEQKPAVGATGGGKPKPEFKPKKTHGNTSKPNAKPVDNSKPQNIGSSSSRSNTGGGSQPRMTAGKKMKIAVEKWKKSEPKLGDYTVGRGKVTPSSRAKFEKDKAAWKAKDPRNK